MKIDSSSIQMASMRQYVEVDNKKESLSIWNNNSPNQTAAKAPADDKVTLSERAMKGSAVPSPDPLQDTDIDPKYMIIKLLLERLTGKQITLMKPSNITRSPQSAGTPTPDGGKEAAAGEGWGVIFESSETHYESEQTVFNTSGTIKTQEGKKINFSVKLSMNREFSTSSNTSFRAGDAKRIDPLVINLGGNAAQLAGSKFSFDLDSDGKKDSISFVAPGSGFLALDVNGDGKINNGKELFGPSSGNGFMELAKYDSDGNNWIDENDPVYGRLSVWTMNASDKSSLAGLKELGIGALYLSNIATGFDFRDTATNSLSGQLKGTGIYLGENGNVGTMQQIDLAKIDTTA